MGRVVKEVLSLRWLLLRRDLDKVNSTDKDAPGGLDGKESA